MAKLEQVELNAHRHQIVADVRKLVERYRAIFDWDVPDIDQDIADQLILTAIRESLDDVARELVDEAKSKSG